MGAPQNSGQQRYPWQSRTVMLAALISLVGIAMWMYASATRTSVAAPSGAESRMATGFAVGAKAPSASAKPRMVDTAGAAVSRFGLSFLGGFGIGWASRKFLRWTLLLAALVGGGLYLAQRYGLIDLSSSEIERHVKEGVSAAQSGASWAKEFLTGYIPSATSAAIGAFIGFRRA